MFLELSSEVFSSIVTFINGLERGRCLLTGLVHKPFEHKKI